MDRGKGRTQVNKLDALVTEARRQLATTEGQLARLVDEVGALTAAAAERHAELQRVLEQFGLEPALNEPAMETHAPETGAHFDIEALRAGAEVRTAELNQSIALRTNLSSAHVMIQRCIDQLAPDQVFRSVLDPGDLRLQQAMTAAREDERRRLARELHDGPAQVLANALHGIEMVEKTANTKPESVPDVLERLRALLRDGASEVRRFAFNLRPATLEARGLLATIRAHVDEHQRLYGRPIELAADDPLPTLTDDQELALFRIMQEALQNVEKHAGADARAQVELRHRDDRVLLTVSDTGKGFDPQEVASRRGGGSGITGMRERATVVGGDLEIASTIDVGTTVQLVVRTRMYSDGLDAAQRGADEGKGP